VTTVADHRPPQPINDYWMAALKFYATGRTSRALRVMAGDEELTRALAIDTGITEDAERAQILGIAAAIDELAVAGLTPEGAYNLAGLEEALGRPFADYDPDASRTPSPRTAPDGALSAAAAS
jgi:hypothetical protein